MFLPIRNGVILKVRVSAIFALFSESRFCRGEAYWHFSPAPACGSAVHREANQAGRDFRRSSGDRDREHPTVRGRAAALGELAESLERQTATSEVLEVISRSPGNLQLVLEAMLEKAVRICDAKFGNIYRWDGELLHLLAAHNTPPALVEARRQSGIRATSFTRRMVRRTLRFT